MEIKNNFRILLAIKETRDGREYTYDDIYNETGISPRTLAGYKQNRVNRFDAATLLKVCEFLDCDIGDLLTVKNGSVPVHASLTASNI